MKRGQPLRSASTLRRTAIRAVSAKARARQRARADVLRQLVDARGAWCEALLDGCDRIACDGHELKRRSQGGSTVDPDNVLLLCRPCHRYVTEHPAEAVRIGLAKWGWQ